MARLIGEVRVSVLPDGTRFRPEAIAILRKAIAGITASIPLTPDVTLFRAKAVAEIKAALAGVNPTVRVSAYVDPATLAKVAGEKAAMAAPVETSLKARLDESSVALARATLKREMGDTMGLDYKVDPTKVIYLKKRLERYLYTSQYDKSPLALDYTVDPAKVAVMKRYLERYLSGNESIGIGFDPAQLASIQATVDAFTSGTATKNVNVSVDSSDIADAEAQLLVLQQEVSKKLSAVKIAVDTSGVDAALAKEAAAAIAAQNRIAKARSADAVTEQKEINARQGMYAKMFDQIAKSEAMQAAQEATANAANEAAVARIIKARAADYLAQQKAVQSAQAMYAGMFDQISKSEAAQAAREAAENAANEAAIARIAKARMADYQAQAAQIQGTMAMYTKMFDQIEAGNAKITNRADLSQINYNVAPAPPPPENTNWLAQTAQVLGLNAAINSLRASFTKMGNTSEATAALAKAAANTIGSSFIEMGAGGGGAWGFLTNKIVLFAGVLDRVLPTALTRVGGLHLATDWVIEFGAVFIPATIAVVAFGAAIAPVVADAVLRLKAMQQAAAATGTSIGIFNYNAKGAVGPMQALQNKLQPVVWEVFGDAINVVTKKTGVFSSLVTSVGTVVEDLAARMTAAFSSQAATSFLKNGALDFQRFGTIIGNLGGAFGNFIKIVPGYAEVIQELFVKISAGIEWFTAIASPILKAGLALHGFFLYTGLAVTAGVALIVFLVNAAAKFFTFAAAAVDLDTVLLKLMYAWDALKLSVISFNKSMLALALNPYIVGLALLGAAIYEVTIHWNAADAATTQFADNLTATIAQMQGGDALQRIPQAFGQITSAIQQAGSPQAFKNISNNWQNLGNAGNRLSKDVQLAGGNMAKAWKDFQTPGGFVSGIASVGKAILNIFGGSSGFEQGNAVMLQMRDNIGKLEAAFHQLTGFQQNLLTVTGDLMTNFKLGNTSTFTWAQSLGILNAAGVQASDSLQLMSTKVEGLLSGWKQFGLNATQIGNAVNAISLQTEMQQSSIQTLTGAYSNFINVVTGGETAFATFGQGMNTLSQALSSAGASGVTFNNNLGQISTRGTAVGATMNGLTQASLNVRGAFAQQVTGAQNLYNSLLTMSSVSAQGAQGQQDLAAAGKDMVATLLPLAKGSKAATAEVYALAQVAGYQGADSFKALAQWVSGVKKPMQDLNKREQDLTVASANLLKDTQNLAGAMGQTLTTAISGAIFVAEKGPQALQKLADAMQALQTGKGSVTGVEQALKSMLPALVQMTGSLPHAHDQFLAMAGAMGITKDKAEAMWKAVVDTQGAGKAVATLTTQTNTLATAFKNFGQNQSKANLQAVNKDFSALAGTLLKVNGSLGPAGAQWMSLAKTLGIGHDQALALWQSWVKLQQQTNPLTKATQGLTVQFQGLTKGLGLSAGAINQLWGDIKNQNLDMISGKATSSKAAFIQWAVNGLGESRAAAEALWKTNAAQNLDTLAGKAGTTKASFVNLAMNGLQLTSKQANDLWTMLRMQYLDTLVAKGDNAKSHFISLAESGLGYTQAKANALWKTMEQQYLDTLASKSDMTKGRFEKLAAQFGYTTQQADALWRKLHQAPTVQAKVNVGFQTSGTAMASAKIGNKVTEIAAISVHGTATSFNGYAYSGGGKLPGWHNTGDNIFATTPMGPIALQGGEAVVPKNLATHPEFTEFAKTHGIPGFASGGIPGTDGFAKTATAAENYKYAIGQADSGFGSMAMAGFQLGINNAVRAAYAGAGGSASGQSILADAERFKGHKYVWGGASNPQTGWDCSSFVGYILGHDFHMGLPGGAQWNANSHGPVASQYNSEPGFRLVSHNVNDIQAGDLLVENSGGHVGFGVGPNRMFSAYGTAFGTIFSDAQNMTNIYRDGTSSGKVFALAAQDALTNSVGTEVAQLVAGSAALSSLFPQLGGGYGGDPGSLAGVGAGAGGFESLSALVAYARYFMSQGLNAAAAAGMAGTISGEQNSLGPESRGSGGWGLIGWTGNTVGLPPGYHGPTGNVAYDLAQQLKGVIGYMNARGGPGPLNAAGNPVAAGDVWSRYEAPASALSDTRPGTAIAVYNALVGGAGFGIGSKNNAAPTGVSSVPTLGRAMGGMVPTHVFDSGGTLAPGPNMVYNLTGKPEHLTPTDSANTCITLEVSSSGDSEFEKFMLMAIRKWVRIKGAGNVQKTFGKNH